MKSGSIAGDFLFCTAAFYAVFFMKRMVVHKIA